MYHEIIYSIHVKTKNKWSIPIDGFLISGELSHQKEKEYDLLFKIIQDLNKLKDINSEYRNFCKGFV